MEVYFPPSVFFFGDDDGGGERRRPTTLSLLPLFFFRGTNYPVTSPFFSGKSGDGTRTYSTLDFRLRFSPLRRVCMQSGHFRLSSLPERERGEKQTQKSRKCQTRRRFEFLNLNRWKKKYYLGISLALLGANRALTESGSSYSEPINPTFFYPPT